MLSPLKKAGAVVEESSVHIYMYGNMQIFKSVVILCNMRMIQYRMLYRFRIVLAPLP